MKKIVKNFEEATKVITTINQLTSLRNFQNFKKNKLKFLCYWLYDILLVSVYIYIKYMWELLSLENYPKNSERLMYSFLLYMFCIGFLSLIFIGLYQSKNIMVLVKEFEKVDENLRKLGCKIEYRPLYAHVVGFGLFWLLNTLLLCVIYIKWTVSIEIGPYTMASIFTYIYGTNVASIVLYDFKIYVYWLGCRFKQTNELLRTFFVEGHQIETDDSILDTSYNLSKRFSLNKWLSEHSFHGSHVHPSHHPLNIKYESQSIKKVHLLQQIRCMHLQLCGVSKMLNRTFDMQLMVYVSMTLIYITTLLYYLYTVLSDSQGLLNKLNVIIVYTAEVISYCIKIVIVSYSCEYTTNQANRAIEIIHACSVYEIDTELKDEILQFSLQMSHTQLGKTKSVFFRLNYTFIRNCVSFVATYLVIMIQWNQTFDMTPLESSH
ncbi:Putative gustatory receptor 28b [Anthophora quadrimaculata]